MKQLKTYFFIFTFSLIFFLYLSETYLTFFLYKGGEGRLDPNLNYKEKILKDQTGKDYDKRTKIQFYEDLKALKENVSVTIDPFFLSSENFFYLGGVSNTQTVDCNENGYFSNYFSDRYGFNNIDAEWDEQEIEFFLIGDSFVHGSCVNRPDDIASNLRKLSNNPVLNLGYRGNGPLTQYATLREYLPKNTKNILWFYFEENDLSNLKLEMKNETLLRYLTDKKYSNNLKTKQKQIDQMLKLKIKNNMIKKKELDKYWESYYSTKKKLLRFIRLNQFKRFLISIKKNRSKNDDNFTLSKLEEILIASKQIAYENNSKFYFVYLGAYHRYKSSFNSHKYKKNYPKIIKIVNNLDIPLIDITNEFFLKTKDPLIYFPFREYGHYNVDGYKKISEIIFKRTK